jgi:glycosyltransferase involved in cell wall biosynthesis
VPDPLLISRPHFPEVAPGINTPASPGLPEFTVVIPARNEAGFLLQTLEAIGRQTVRPAEVIVVDNASTDDTAQIACAWGARVLACTSVGVSPARQLGLEEARTAWVASTDADSLPDSQWIERLQRAAPGRVALYGPLCFSGTPGVQLASRLAYRSFLEVCVRVGRPNLAGANMAFSRQAAHLAGGYPAVKALEDVMLGQALARLGRVAYVPGALVQTSPRRLEIGVLPFLWRHVKNLSGHTQDYFPPTPE